MPATKLPRWGRDSPIRHDQLNALAEAAERADNLAADGSSGVQVVEGRGGRTIGLNLPPGHYNAKVTAQVGLASSDGLTLGSGTADLYVEQAVPDGTIKLAPAEVGATIYFGAPSGGSTTAIPAGQMVVVARMASGIYQVITGYC